MLKKAIAGWIVLLAVPSIGCSSGLDEEAVGKEAVRETSHYVTAANGLPLLNSLPGAGAAIFLDFDGGQYSQIVNGHYVTHGPYNESGSDPATFDAVEQQVIIDAWKRVSIWFSVFNVNVSTDPNVAGDRVWLLIGNDVPSGGAGSYTGFPSNNIAKGRIVSGWAKAYAHSC